MQITPRCSISIRVATMSDLAFIDRLQDMHTRMVGYFRRAALEGKIAAGNVLIAEDETRLPIGYCMSSNRYLKRDELGVIYQMNVVPGAQRKLVAATLLKAVFERAPFGCKLYCCWCAQDLDANNFWESMGFVPLAFRTGAVGEKSNCRPQARTHIFWQRRIRAGDCETPYWFPAKTDAGMMREDRLVLPIPPGVHWKDEMPILLPEAQRALPEPVKNERSGAPAVRNSLKPIAVAQRRVQFGSPDAEPVPLPVAEKASGEKPKRAKVKADPKLIAAARELRDRYLEQFNAGVLADGTKVLPSAKYDVARQIEAIAPAAPLLLEQAA